MIPSIRGLMIREVRIYCKPFLLGDSLAKRAKRASLRIAPAVKPAAGGCQGDQIYTPQQAAVQHLLKFGKEDKPGGTCLVWAACGAGKTEVSFPDR